MCSDLLQPLPLNEHITQKLNKRHIYNIWDLLLHLPSRYEDETRLNNIATAPIDVPCLIEGTVIQHHVQSHPRKQFIALIRDKEGNYLNLRFIHFYPHHQQQLLQGETVRVFGEIRQHFHGLEMIHPKIRSANDPFTTDHLTPIYPNITGINQEILRQSIQNILSHTAIHDSLPTEILKDFNLPSLAQSLNILHNPSIQYIDLIEDKKHFPAWQRLKFDELLAQQLSMLLAKQQRKHNHAPTLIGNQTLTQHLLAQLPFSLTHAQQRVLQEIRYDMAQSYPMHRLLQGDVGSGKTIVAALVALTALEANEHGQIAIMAPTEILAEQHYIKFKQWLEPMGIPIAWITGSLRKKTKDQAKIKLANGNIRLAIGTHALFQNDIIFKNLNLMIIDEQHRFGVEQRLALKNKGQSVHQLMMSATPIPRTLAMSFFADLDVSIIDELPPQRTPIQTRLVQQQRRQEVEGFVLNTCQQGGQAYWVCPLIEESESLQLQTATQTLNQLRIALPNLRIELIHGRMKSIEKAEIMTQFSQGHIHVLVATTVIEVGVDVPNASLMVIEHAERMGLSQLHQLRGRVGRGQRTSNCILMFTEPLSDTARQRLKIIYQNNDGFEIARQDLRLRGPGEVLGSKQSGVPMLRFADINEDSHLIEMAHQLASKLITQYPDIAQQHLNLWQSNKHIFLNT